MTTTYTMLRSGEWGIRSTSELHPHSMVSVAKKSGEVKGETVGRVVWSGNGVWLATIARPERSPSKRFPSKSRPGTTYERGVGLICDECGERAERGTRCWETGAMH